jgi:FKBP-type peptidyl-prolyl cis-trans isomerase
MRLSVRPVFVAAALTSLAASCTPELPVAPATDIQNTTFASSLGIDLTKMTKTSSGLYYQDTQVGSGTTVIAGYHVTVHYTLYLPNGVTVETSVGKSPLQFTVGANPRQVIAGFDEGMVGMRVGGTRKLIIPPELGYGAVETNGIPANSILVYTVQLISVP